MGRGGEVGRKGVGCEWDEWEKRSRVDGKRGVGWIEAYSDVHIISGIGSMGPAGAIAPALLLKGSLPSHRLLVCSSTHHSVCMTLLLDQIKPEMVRS